MKGRRYKKQGFYNFISPLSNAALYRFVCVFMILAFLVIIVSGVLIGRELKNELKDNESSQSNSIGDGSDAPSSLLGAVTSVTEDDSQIGYGDLILVNYQYRCAYDNPDSMVSMLDNSAYNYSVSDYEVMIMNSVFDYADKLLGDFEAQSSDPSYLNVACAYRSSELQETLYNDKLQTDGQEEADRWIAKPGYSEHQTGLAFDLSIFKDGATYDYTGDGEYSWINENCYKYGFIVRYPVDRTETTKIEYEPWHFRYVGAPHAEYIFKSNLCFEDYIDLLHTKTVSNPLVIASENGNYAVYYCPKDSNSQSTSVTVPLQYEYTISGDNINGFIVTVKLP